MASNNTAKFCHKIETNAMGESSNAYQTKTNKKANYTAATGISEATNFTINTANNDHQFHSTVDQTKANWGNALVWWFNFASFQNTQRFFKLYTIKSKPIEMFRVKFFFHKMYCNKYLEWWLFGRDKCNKNHKAQNEQFISQEHRFLKILKALKNKDS